MARGTLIGSLFVDLIARTGNFERGMARARRSLAATAARMKRIGRKMTRIGKTLTTRLTLPMLLLGASTLKTAGDFEAAMKIVEAKSGAAGSDLQSLENRARQMGKTTKFSAVESAKALVILARAGKSAHDQFVLLPQVLTLAAASGRDLDSTASTLIATMNQFSLGTEDAAHISDVLVVAARSANLEVGDLQDSLRFAGKVGKDFGLSLEETVASLVLLAKSEVKSTMGGRVLRQAIAKLVKPSDDAKRTLKGLGVRIFNVGGKMRKFTTIMRELSEAGISGRQVLELFQIRGLNALSLIRASKELGGLTDILKNKVAGAATKDAQKRLEGLNGSLAKLRAAFVELQIAIGKSGLIKWATEFVTRLRDFLLNISELNPALLKWGTVIAILLAVLGPFLVIIGQLLVLGGFLLAQFAALAAILGPLVFVMAKAALIIGLFAAAVVLAVIAVGQLAGQLHNLSTEIAKAVGPSLFKATKSFKLFTDTLMINLRQFKKGMLQEFSDLKDKAAGRVLEMMQRIKDIFTKDFDNLVNNLNKKRLLIQGIFTKMANFLIFRSLIPDMVAAIGKSFLGMSTGMVANTEKGAKGVVGIFEVLGAATLKSVTDTAKKIQEKFKALFKRRPLVVKPPKKGPKKDENELEKPIRKANKALLALQEVGVLVGKALTKSLGSALDDFVDKGKFSMNSFRNFASEALKDVAKAVLRAGILGPRGTGKGGLVGVLGGLFGFRRGGSFAVGGSGGADSQLVAFKATPGEEVSVRRPGQMGAGGVVVKVDQHFGVGVAQTVRAEMVAMRPQMEAGIANKVADQRMRGGSFSRAITGGS